MDHFCYLCFVFVMLSCLFIVALLPPAGKRLKSWLSCVWCFLCFCHFPMWCPGSGVVLDCMDSRSLPLTFVMIKLYQNPEYSKLLTRDDSRQTLSDFEYNMLRWANKKLIEPKLLTWDVDLMVSEDFLSIFFSLWEQITHRCGGGQFIRSEPIRIATY